MQTIEMMRRAVDTPRVPVPAHEAIQAIMMLPQNVSSAVPRVSEFPSAPPTIGPIGAPDPDVIWNWIIRHWAIAGSMYEELYKMYENWLTGDPSRLDQIWNWYSELSSGGGEGISINLDCGYY